MDRVLCKVYSIYGKTVADNFTDRVTGRIGEAAQKKAASKTVQDFALQRYGPNAKISWSRKLGCSCGCSPGWRVGLPTPDFSDPAWESKSKVTHYDDRFAGQVKETKRGGWGRTRSGPLEVFLEDNDSGEFTIRSAARDGEAFCQFYPLPENG